MWHMTSDMWHMIQIEGWQFSQNFSSLALPAGDWECLEDILTEGSLNESINHEAVCKIAAATSGLLITFITNFQDKMCSEPKSMFSAFGDLD